MAVYELSNNYLSVCVQSKGAELCSVKNKSGKELLWQANPDVWPRFAPVLFPIVGRLINNSFNYQDKSYSLSQHGFARDKEFVLIDRTQTSLSFELTADEESLKLFPFHFSLIVSYFIDDNRLKTTYKVFNPSNDSIYFSIGAHPGFSTTITQGESLSDYKLIFPGKEYLTAEVLHEGLLSGEQQKIELDNNTLQLSPALFEKDALVFMNGQIEHVQLVSQKSGNCIDLDCEGWPYFGIWTKKGCDQFVCLEPWFGITDSIHSKGDLTQKTGIIRINKKDSFTSSFGLKFQ